MNYVIITARFNLCIMNCFVYNNDEWIAFSSIQYLIN